jgi:glutathione synthase/RimK-type ligase-like ATP-grasp enzyme
MKIAFQINKIETLKPTTDTSLLIMQECLKIGFDVCFYYPESLSFKNGEFKDLNFTSNQITAFK